MQFIEEIQDTRRASSADTKIQDKKSGVVRVFAYLVSRILYLCILHNPKFESLPPPSEACAALHLSKYLKNYAQKHKISLIYCEKVLAIQGKVCYTIIVQE